MELGRAGRRDRQARHLRDEPCRVRDRRKPRALRWGTASRSAEAQLRAHDFATSADAAGADGAGVSGGEDKSGGTVPQVGRKL